MGRNSRRRKRAALREQHDRRHTSGAPPHAATSDARGADRPQPTADDAPRRYDEAAMRPLLLMLAGWDAHPGLRDRFREAVDALAGELFRPDDWAVVTATVDAIVITALTDARGRGWDHLDVAHAVRVLVSARATRMVVAFTEPPPATSTVPSREATGSIFERWRQAAALDRRTALAEALRVIGQLDRLGRLPKSSPRASAGQVVDEALLAKVRALLAKAEATTFPAEAEAFTEKAQQLMSRHSIDAAMVAAATRSAGSGAARGGTVVRRVHLDDPYAMQKAELLHVVAEANGARSVVISDVRLATLVGYPSDLDLVELLFTSLLLQANQAMAEAGRGGAEDRSTTFRRSFLMAYTVRIRERLTDARREAEAAGEQTYGAALVPALLARTQVVDHAFTELFPHARSAGARRSIDGRGWQAGRSAADRADVAGARRRLAG